MSIDLKQFSKPEWLADNGFLALSKISRLLESNENLGRDALIRLLEHRDLLASYSEIISSLVQRSGLYPYLKNSEILDISDLLNYEYHTAEGLDDIHLHSKQAQVYRALIDGLNVILSAPTSFGKSLLIDTIIASKSYNRLVIIVPTIALIDETRRRLTERFGDKFKIITHPNQERTGNDIFVLTQERFIEFDEPLSPDFFVLDEFYKLSPNRGDERTFTLNRAFYKLFKSGAQFFLIGPNIQDIRIDEKDLNFRFFKFDFSTVATEVRYSESGSHKDNALEICQSIDSSTLIFCKSANSAYELAENLIRNGVSAPSDEAAILADWLRDNYHQDWTLPKFLDHGIAVHHGALPRSVAYHLLRKFNEGSIKFLLCTSTIIEGVNTVAKNIIIYDNKIANKKFDNFTFNNIKGRAGRMFQHFVGHVYVLHPEPELELPIVDIPAITQSSDSPDSLLIHIDSTDLSDSSKEQLKYLHAQDYLPFEVLKQNDGIAPNLQIDLAIKLSENHQNYYPLLTWTGYPTSKQLNTCCELIFEYLLKGKRTDGVASSKQLAFMLQRLQNSSIASVISQEINNSNPQFNKTPSVAVEHTLKFLRSWCEFNMPRLLGTLESIQKATFARCGYKKLADYSVYSSAVKHLFMPPAVTILEEYGLPYSVTKFLHNKQYELGENVDSILKNIRNIDPHTTGLSGFELETLQETLNNI